jgi:hypothetical protein
MFVAPSTSDAARSFWDERIWRDAAVLAGLLP